MLRVRNCSLAPSRGHGTRPPSTERSFPYPTSEVDYCPCWKFQLDTVVVVVDDVEASIVVAVVVVEAGIAVRLRDP